MSLSLLYAEYIMRNARLDESQAEIKLADRNMSNLRYADDAILMAESEEELKSLLMSVKKESEKAGLKLNSKNEDHGIWSHHFMANKWETNENSGRLIFLGSKITADSECSCETKNHLLLGRKAMTNLDSILKSRGITLPTKVHIVEAMFFLVVTYGCLDLDHKEG